MSRRVVAPADAPSAAEDFNAPIEVFADNAVIDGGIAAVPKMLLRFARFLTSSGEGLNDRQILLTVMVVALHEERNLRLSNLPMTAALSTLDSDLTHLRKTGLVFTQRDYYPVVEGRPPRMRSQIWDIRSLTANLDRVQRLWFARQAGVLANWKASNRQGRRPVYEFPSAFRHEVILPGPVVEDIAMGRFFPVPDKWRKLARAQFSGEDLKRLLAHAKATPVAAATIQTAPTARITAGRASDPAPTVGIRAGRQAPTESITGGHLLTPSLFGETQPVVIDAEKVFACFGALKGEAYQPTGRDHQTLKQLRGAGYSHRQVVAAMEAVFARGDRPRRFAYCAELVQEMPPACPPAVPARSAESGEPEGVELAPELAQIADQIRGPQPGDTCRQIQSLVVTFGETAQLDGSSGVEWVKEAIELSLDKAQPLVYAAAILRNWKTAGRDRPREVCKTGRAGSIPKKHRGQQETGTRWNESVDA